MPTQSDGGGGEKGKVTGHTPPSLLRDPSLSTGLGTWDNRTHPGRSGPALSVGNPRCSKELMTKEEDHELSSSQSRGV